MEGPFIRDIATGKHKRAVIGDVIVLPYKWGYATVTAIYAMGTIDTVDSNGITRRMSGLSPYVNPDDLR